MNHSHCGYITNSQKNIGPPIFLQTLQSPVISEMYANTTLNFFKNTEIKECKTYI
jgi:hypothetical protein